MGARPSVLVAAEVKRTEAEAARATAEAEATRAKSAAEAFAARSASYRANYRALAPLALLALAGGSLAADWYFHEYVPHIKRRMEAMLRTRGVAETKQPEWSVQVKRAPLILGQLPVMVLGPSGCGKSTLLAGVLRDARATGTPSLLLHWRRQQGRDSLKDAAVSVNANAELEAAAQHVFPQIGFPTRRSFVGSLLTNGVWNKWAGVEAKLPAPTADRLAFAMRLLFEVSETMYFKRLGQGISLELARPVLMFDEVQDLVRDERLALMGGRLVFDQLASLLVTYGVDRGVVRTAAAGSSAMLAVEFNKTVANGFRWNRYMVTDPDKGDVLKALQSRGYTEQEAASMVELCGTRLRLLQGPLTDGAAALDASVFLADMRATAQDAFLETFLLFSTPHSRKSFAAVLDSIERFEQHVSKIPPSLKHLPANHSANDFSCVIYVNPGKRITFQSQLHRSVWATIRETILL